MDFDGDGHLDLVSGSYDPGEIYLFRGQGKGQFAAREVIKDKSGKPILRVPDQKDRVESFGSWLALVDWDSDGDLDILVGTFGGQIFLRRNEGSRTRPEYAAVNEWVMLGKKRLRVPGAAHANPVIVDWDGDGRWDIVTGSSDGGVYWYRNIGKKDQPEFTAPVALVPKHDGIGYHELLPAGQDPKPGIRSQIAVVDYDGDGKLDLLLGDFCTYLHLKKDMSAADRKQFDALRAEQTRSGEKAAAIMQRTQDKYREMMKGIPQSDWHTPENSAKWSKLYQEMRSSPEFKKYQEESDRLGQQMLKFVDRSLVKQGGPDVPHGFVWLFRRK